MPNRALASLEESLACLYEIAGRDGATTSQAAMDAFARSYSFHDWAELAAFIHNSSVLVDAQTAQFTRVLETDMASAWEYLATPAKVETWMFPVQFEPRPGASFNFLPEGWHGKIGIFEHGREIRFDAVAGGWTWFRLASIDGETVFTLLDFMAPDYVVPPEIRRHHDSLDTDQPGGQGTHWQGVLAGWHQGMDTLQDTFSGAKREWDYDALCRLYDILIADYHRAR